MSRRDAQGDPKIFKNHETVTKSYGRGILWGSPWYSLRKTIKNMIWGYPATSKFEYRSRAIVKITVPVNLRKKLQNFAEFVYLDDFVTTLGAQMLLNVTLGAFEWESEILCFFATR